MVPVDRLSSLLERFRISTRMSFSGLMCGKHVFAENNNKAYLHVMRRGEAMELGPANRVRAARAVYLVGDQPLHLRSVLKDTPLFEALKEVLADGGLVVAVGGSADALCDPMIVDALVNVDPLDAAAGLPRVKEGAIDDVLDGVGQVRVGPHIGRVFAAEL